MKLVFITDNGFYDENGKTYFSGANLQHITTMNKHFSEISIIAQKTLYDGTNLELEKKNSLLLLKKRGIVSNRMIENEIIKADFVICFGFNGLIGHYYARKHNKKVIVYVGGCVYDTWRNIGSTKKKILAPLLKKIFQISIKNADYVQYVDEYLTKVYPTKGRYLICPSANVKLNNNLLKGRLKKNLKPPYTLGIIGYSHNNIKGIDTIIKALPYVKHPVKLEVVGKGNPTRLIKLANNLKVGNEVNFLGTISDREAIFDWLGSVDLYLQPSLTEGLPRATLEAMSVGCPIISTSAGGLISLVPSERRINFGDYLDLAKKINILFNNAREYNKVAKATFEKAGEYSVEELDSKRDKFYSSIVWSHKYK